MTEMSTRSTEILQSIPWSEADQILSSTESAISALVDTYL